ncbi:MAG: carboxy terminal-processing peptidase [Salibacteraceae bacterium]|nr:carboxy terminal-processing peptidase [Salibacteraceae bacterium]MDP4763923.1 carboxy terminal-processing peptidase [Salibacteraceae bacterium]MDP4934217.1 carboxy terminal-processing peptidase [Salibacteraceae bacterium]MDP4964527.1 carboxy terminal-processing peptidase [Salibacteraceae bacterium]
MKLRGLQIIYAAVAAVSLCSYILYETSSSAYLPADTVSVQKDQVLMRSLMESLNAQHFLPKQIDDEFSKDAFRLYLERMDFNKRFLLASDVEAFKMYETRIDDETNAGTFKFFDLSYEVLQERMKEAQGYYRELLAQPFDYQADEEIELDEEKREFATTRNDLKELWRKLLKYQTLARITEDMEKQEKAHAENDTVTLKTFDELEKSSREFLLKSNDRFFERMSKWEREDQKEVYINSIVNVYGPHTGFFPPKDKENFDISMSGQLEGIGAQLREKDGYIKVENIVPGSPSYRQGDLEEGDLIIKVAQEKEDPVDVTDMRLDDAVKLIRGKKGTVVTLTVKKLNGSIQDIAITRDIVLLEETYAKSVIVENELGKKVGYIRLPKFYADFNRNGGRASAEDVRLELEKLKAEGIDGVVLDLRGNGGGSLNDAIDMTGHFIKTGPVVQVKGRYTKAEVMSDRNNAVTYDGPLVVMTNHFSASASEILAAAIQDYDRGIILGASSSFGKGTVQRFYDLDQKLDASEREFRPLGAVKVTTQKFYRINGDATQLKGVVPDILIPDQYNYIDLGEKEQDFVMPWDEIAPAIYTPWKPSYNESKIIASSEKRIKKDETMQLIDENAKRLKSQRNETLVNLNFDKFVAYQKELDKAAEKYENLMKPLDDLKIHNLKVDIDAFEGDTVKLDINEKWIKKLNKDIYLDEAINVIAEMAVKS